MTETPEQAEARRNYIRCLLLKGSPFAPANLDEITARARAAMAPELPEATP